MPAVVADVLSDMAVLNNGLRVGAGGPDEARAIRALSMTQHYFETVVATLPHVLGTTIDVGTVAQTETTSWPTTLLRLDAIWFLNDTTGRPIARLKRISEIGGHVPSLPWPLTLSLDGAASGQTAGYFANMHDFYWMPLPDGVHSLRIYGFVEQAEFAQRTSPFNYPLRCKLSFATFATKLLRISLDDDPANLDDLASSVFKPLLRGLRRFDRAEPVPRYYGDVHTS